MSTRVHVAGVGMTPFGRQPDETVRSLATQATDAALRDAGLTTDDVELVVFANAAQGVLTGQEMIRGQAAFHGYGFKGVAILNVENACASGSTAFQVAANAVASGAVDVALAVGSEVLTHEDKSRTMATFSCAVDLEAMSGMREQVERSLLHRVPGVDGPQQSALMDLYAETARRFLERGGATIRDVAQVAVKNRAHAALNPLAQFHALTTVEQDDRRYDQWVLRRPRRCWRRCSARVGSGTSRPVEWRTEQRWRRMSRRASAPPISTSSNSMSRRAG
jgi:acetyl-CoA acyltransferase